MAAPQLWTVVVVGEDGRRARRRQVIEDEDRPEVFREHLIRIARQTWPHLTDSGDGWISDFEIEVWRTDQGDAEPARTYRYRKD